MGRAAQNAVFAAAIALVPACYSPAPPQGAPCDPSSDSCPTGQHCVRIAGQNVCSNGAGDPQDANDTPGDDAPVPDARVNDGPPGDADGDGIADAADNCPTVANTNQYNEDGDRFGDACDPCPPVADDAPPDDDSDGVANACDPRPTTGGDVISLFEGFHQGVPTTWSKTGTWSASGDSVSTSPTAAAELATAGPAATHETVSVALIVDGGCGQADCSIGLFDLYDSATGAGIGCHLARRSSTSTPLVANLFKQRRTNEAVYEVVTGRSYNVADRHDTTTHTCSARSSLGAQQTLTITSALTNSAPKVGIRVVRANATFHWLMIVTNP